MRGKISAVINTYNEEKNIARAIKSVKWADEVIVCDMYSEDGTSEIAQSLGARVYFHKKTRYVEPARNFAISKAKGDWILVLDADEEVPAKLAKKLQEVAQTSDSVNFVQIPRKNIIFGKWIKSCGWWPDYHIRFFKKGTVVWSNKIHSKPQTKGEGIALPAEEDVALQHYHYTSAFQYIERLNRYTDIQAKELFESGYQFQWTDLIKKPLSEFLSRYFAHQGYKDGLHGLVLSLLQAFSFLVEYIKVWEMEKFKQQDISLQQLQQVSKEAGFEIRHWFKASSLSKNPLKKIIQKVTYKIS